MKFEFEQNENGIKITDSLERLKAISEKYSGMKREEKPDIARMFNRFSGTYVSPTFMKSFMNCPAKCFLNNFDKREENVYTNIGSCTHKIFERHISEDNYDFDGLIKEECTNFNITRPCDIATIRRYVDNFKNSFKKDPNLIYLTEYFVPTDLTILGVPLKNIMCLIDLVIVDTANQTCKVIDYKTGKISTVDYNITNYRNQMIFYTWVIREAFGFKTIPYLYLVDIDELVEVPFNIVDESKLIDGIYEYYEEIKRENEAGYYKEIVNNNCKYCNQRDNCYAFCNENKINVEITNIIKEIEYEDN